MNNSIESGSRSGGVGHLDTVQAHAAPDFALGAGQQHSSVDGREKPRRHGTNGKVRVTVNTGQKLIDQNIKIINEEFDKIERMVHKVDNQMSKLQLHKAAAHRLEARKRALVALLTNNGQAA